MLHACSKDAAINDETLSAAPEIPKIEMPTPLTFAQMRQIVADVLGDEVAAKITPTARYLKFTFDNTDRMFTELAKGEIEYLSEPLYGEQAEQFTATENQPRPMYALVNSNVKLPEGVACEVLAESFDPLSPLSGLTAEQVEQVMRTLFADNAATRAVDPAYVWKPTGRIEIRDDVADDYVALPNLKVIVTGYVGDNPYALQTETCTTNSEGRFACTKEFFGLVAHQIKWSSVSSWNILSDESTPAVTGSSFIDRTPWNFVIHTGTPNRALQYATAYRAANYMHRNGYSLSALINGKSSTMNIMCLDQTLPSGKEDEFKPDPTDPTTANLRIYCKNKSALDIYNTVHREAGKASHYLRSYAKSTTDYTNFSKTIIESWGEFTKYYFAEKEYTALGALNRLHTFTSQYPAFTPYPAPKPDALNLQDWQHDTSISATATVHRRTPLFIDLYDNFNQKTYPGRMNTAFGEFPADNFSRQNFSEYVTWSQDCKTISSLKTKVVNTVSANATQKSAAETLFTVYIALEARQNR